MKCTVSCGLVTPGPEYLAAGSPRPMRATVVKIPSLGEDVKNVYSLKALRTNQSIPQGTNRFTGVTDTE